MSHLTTPPVDLTIFTAQDYALHLPLQDLPRRCSFDILKRYLEAAEHWLAMAAKANEAHLEMLALRERPYENEAEKEQLQREIEAKHVESRDFLINKGGVLAITFSWYMKEAGEVGIPPLEVERVLSSVATEKLLTVGEVCHLANASGAAVKQLNASSASRDSTDEELRGRRRDKTVDSPILEHSPPSSVSSRDSAYTTSLRSVTSTQHSTALSRAATETGVHLRAKYTPRVTSPATHDSTARPVRPRPSTGTAFLRSFLAKVGFSSQTSEQSGMKRRE